MLTEVKMGTEKLKRSQGKKPISKHDYGKKVLRREGLEGRLEK